MAITASLRRELAQATSRHASTMAAANNEHAAVLARVEDQLRAANEAALHTSMRCDRVTADLERQKVATGKPVPSICRARGVVHCRLYDYRNSVHTRRRVGGTARAHATRCAPALIVCVLRTNRGCSRARSLAAGSAGRRARSTHRRCCKGGGVFTVSWRAALTTGEPSQCVAGRARLARRGAGCASTSVHCRKQCKPGVAQGTGGSTPIGALTRGSSFVYCSCACQKNVLLALRVACFGGAGVGKGDSNYDMIFLLNSR
jgi:hypothetical protein